MLCARQPPVHQHNPNPFSKLLYEHAAVKDANQTQMALGTDARKCTWVSVGGVLFKRGAQELHRLLSQDLHSPQPL